MTICNKCGSCAICRKREATRKWKAANRDRMREGAKNYRNLPRRKLAQRCINLVAYYRKRFGTVGIFGPLDVLSMMVSQQWRCARCGASIREVYEIDHIHPASKGGTSWPTNLQLLCPPCNCAKADQV